MTFDETKVSNNTLSTNPDYDVAVDRVNGKEYQLVKLINGTEGSETPADLATDAKLDALLTELQAKADVTETQPVSAASLPLPSGAATDTKLDSVITQLQALLTELQAKADLAETQPVSAASLPLPSGAATSANQGTMVGYLASIDADTSAIRNDLADLAPPAIITAGSKSVTSAGTAVQLAAISTSCLSLVMSANDTNTGKIYYGGSTVSSETGAFIFPGQTVELRIDDVQKVYIDADTSGDGVKYTYFSR